MAEQLVPVAISVGSDPKSFLPAQTLPSTGGTRLPLPGWNAVANVYINPLAGNDDNDGLTSGTALATLEEHHLRMGSQTLAVGFTQTVHFPAGSFTADFWRLTSTTPVTGTTVFQGEIEDVAGASGAITSVVDWDPVAKTCFKATVPTIDFSAYATHYGEYWVRVVGGPRDGLKLPIARVVSAHVIESSGGEDPTAPYTIIYPQIGDTVQVYRPTRLLVTTPSNGAFQIGEVLLYDLFLGEPGGTTPHVCVITAASAVQPGVELHSCAVYGLDGEYGSVLYSYGSILSQYRSYGWSLHSGTSICDNVQLRDGSHTEIEDSVLFETFIQLGAYLGRAEMVVSTAACVNNYAANSIIGMGSRLTLSPGATLWFQDGPVTGVAVAVVGPATGIAVGSGATLAMSGTTPPDAANVGGTMRATFAAFTAANGAYIQPDT